MAVTANECRVCVCVQQGRRKGTGGEGVGERVQIKAVEFPALSMTEEGSEEDDDISNKTMGDLEEVWDEDSQ